jgi:hypothetical protein
MKRVRVSELYNETRCMEKKYSVMSTGQYFSVKYTTKHSYNTRVFLSVEKTSNRQYFYDIDEDSP